MTEGQIADRYQPLEVIGRGGEATVIKAVDTRHERLVALKVRATSPALPTEQLLVEARALLSLPPHAGLAHARDDLFDDGHHVLVLDWVDGVNLGRVLSDSGQPGLPVSSVLRWVAQAAEAVTVLHQHGVIHGDIKPANLILDRTGRIVVVDLGSSSIPLMSAPRGGTPGFRAPEIAGGALPDRASDVFSLAATTFALLTGDAPNGGLPQWNGVPAEVAARLEAGLRAGLAIDPARRPATPGQLVEQLRAGWNDQTPTGVGTVLLTDVVGSTEMWAKTPERVPEVLAQMQLVIDRCVEDHGGRRLGATVEGDASLSTFPNATNAVSAAIAVQRGLPPGGLRVRAGLATGELIPVEGDVLGPTVNRAARVRDRARAGEVLLAASTADVLRAAPPPGVGLLPLGPHALRGFDTTEEIAAVVAEGVTSPPDPTRSPYPGLAPFALADADLFFGREEVVVRCRELLGANGFVGVVGASGSGKTSVALGGLAPCLPHVVIVRPGVHPLISLDEARLAENPDATLIVDQLEELVTLCHDPAERTAFIEAVNDHGGPLIVTVRADLYGEFGTFTEFADRLASSQVLLGPLAAPDLIRAVNEPARRCGLVVEDGLAELIAAELGDAPGTLPLLGHALREAWMRREGRTITVAAYQASGGVRSAIAATAERALAALDESGQLVARHVLLHMVELRPQGEDARRWASRSELAAIESQRAADVVASLADARLIVIDGDQATVVHEALLRAWPRLSEWIAEERTDLLSRQELREATERWTAGGRSDADLYRGARLDVAIELAGHEHLPEAEAAFVEAGRWLRDREHVEARRRTRRLRILAGVASLLAVLALVVGAIAVVQRNDADQQRTDAQQQRTAAEEAARSAEIEALVGRAASMRATQRDTAALLAVEAFHLADTPRTRSEVLATFTDGTGFLDAHRFDAEKGSSGIVMPDGESAYVTGQPDGLIRPYDLASGALGDPLPALGGGFADPGSTLAASPDGRLLLQAAWSTDYPKPVRTTIGIFDVATRSLLFPPIVIPGGVGSAAFTPDGTRVAMTVEQRDARLLLMDTQAGTVLANVPGERFDSKDVLPFTGIVTVGDAFVVGSSGADAGPVRVFDDATLELRSTIDAPPGFTTHLSPVNDATVVASGAEGQTLINVDKGKIVWDHPGNTCDNLTVNPSRHTLYCGDQFGRLVEEDLSTGLEIRRLDAQNGNSGLLFPARGGTELVSFSNNEAVVARWRLDGSGPIDHLVAPGYDAGQFRPDGDQLIVAGSDSERPDERVVDVASGKLVATLDGMFASTWRDDRTVLGATINDAGRLQIAHRDLDGDDRVIVDGFVFDKEPDRTQARTGADRALVAYRDGDGGRRWEVSPFDATEGPLEPTIVVDGLVSMAITNSGDRIAIGTDHGVYLYDGVTGDELGHVEGSSLREVDITAADQLFVSSLGGEVTQYDLETLTPIRTFSGSRGYVQEVVGTSDGSLIALRGGDRRVSLFDVATGTLLGTPITIPDDQFNEMDLAPDGRHLAAGGGPDGVQVWDLDPRHWAAAACRLAGRNLTREEWTTNIGDLAPFHSTCPEFPAGK